MEEHSFNGLTKEMADATITRGQALKLVGGSTLGVLGLVSLPGVAGARKRKRKKGQVKPVTKTFNSSGTITIPAGAPATTTGPATPYPSTINVSGFPGVITKVVVQLNGLTHTFPDDIDMLLVHTGQNAIIMSDVGGSTDVTNINLTLDDSAANPLPDNGPLVSGTFQPTNIGDGDTFPPPAPTPSGNVALSTFNGLNPNGAWDLFIFDDATQDVGTLNSWALQITANVPFKKKKKKRHHH